VSVAVLFPLTANAKARESAGSTASFNELLHRLTSGAFAESLNTTFQIHVSALNVQELELIKVSKTKVSGMAESFDVVFLGRKDKPFEQGAYLIEHSRMGSFPVFVVPVGNSPKGVRYQAVFSRLRQ
jgi:hypothetical protein